MKLRCQVFQMWHLSECSRCWGNQSIPACRITLIAMFFGLLNKPWFLSTFICFYIKVMVQDFFWKTLQKATADVSTKQKLVEKRTKYLDEIKTSTENRTIERGTRGALPSGSEILRVWEESAGAGIGHENGDGLARFHNLRRFSVQGLVRQNRRCKNT